MPDLILQYYALFLDSTTYRVLASAAELFLTVGPFMAIGILIHVLALRFFPDRMGSIPSKQPLLAIALAGLIGMLSPFPTYVAVPIGLSLISIGVPFPVMMAFVVASPLINPSIFFLTFTQLGFNFALARVVSAYILSVAAGLLSLPISKSLTFQKREPRRVRSQRPFLVELYRSVLFFGKYFVIAIFVGAIIKSVVSPERIQGLLARQGPSALLLAVAMGIPFYSCGGAAIPLVDVLRDLGMSDGAALAFFIAGPATKLETLYIYKSLLGVPVLLFYLAITLLGAFLSGFFMMLV